MNYDSDSDEALLDRLARTRDAQAFDVLYRRHTRRLYATAVRLTHDSDTAGDVVHDAWVRAVESAREFERRSTFRTWITGILINRIRELHRAQRRVDDEDSTGLDDVPDTAPSAPLEFLGIDSIDLEAAVGALPPGFRQVLVLHDIEGFTHEEIGTLLGLAPGTSKSQLARARQRVREWLTVGISRRVR